MNSLKRYLHLIVLPIICVSATALPLSDTSFLKAEKGVLDLSSWDFQKDGSVSLGGEWIYFPEQRIYPENIKYYKTSHNYHYMNVPGYWNNIEVNNKKHGGMGFGTLSLKIILPEYSNNLRIMTSDFLTAYDFYAGSDKVISVGEFGNDKYSSKPAFGTYTASVKTDDNILDITVHLSNFHHRDGGMFDVPLLGSDTKIWYHFRLTLIFNIILFSSLFIMGLYNIFLYHLYKYYRDLLFFGTFCLIFAVRVLTTGDAFGYVFFPQIGWNIFNKLEYITFYLSVPCFIMYIFTNSPDVFSNKFPKAIIFISLLFTVAVYSTPSYIYTHLISYYEIMTALAGLYILIRLIKLHLVHRKKSKIMFTGFIVIYLPLINDVLYTHNITSTGYLVPYGLFALIFIQGVIITNRISRAFHTVASQSDELVMMNMELLDEINKRKNLETNLRQSHENVAQSRFAIIMGLAKLAEHRDNCTGEHLERIQEYSRTLAMELSGFDEYRDYITDEYIDDIYHSSILHDIGKVGVPDSILLKTGSLTEEEFELIKQHPVIGGNAIENLEKQMDNSLLTLGREIVYHHHEKWDGSGYPYGLMGSNIPLSARIVALADVYDALTSERPYKSAYSHDTAHEIIMMGKGTHFDPLIIEAYQKCIERFKIIREGYSRGLVFYTHL